MKRIIFALSFLVCGCATAATLDDFSDGDYTADPVWSEVGVSNAAWSVASERAVLSISGDGSDRAGLLGTARAVRESITVTFNADSDTDAWVFVKLCTDTPTAVAQESGCYTAGVRVDNYGVPDTPDFECDAGGIELELYRDTTRLAFGCEVNASAATDYTLTLQARLGTVTASFNGGDVTAEAADTTYTAFSHVGFGVDGFAYADGKGIHFDDVDVSDGETLILEGVALEGVTLE